MVDLDQFGARLLELLEGIAVDVKRTADAMEQQAVDTSFMANLNAALTPDAAVRDPKDMDWRFDQRSATGYTVADGRGGRRDADDDEAAAIQRWQMSPKAKGRVR